MGFFTKKLTVEELANHLAAGQLARNQMRDAIYKIPDDYLSMNETTMLINMLETADREDAEGNLDGATRLDEAVNKMLKARQKQYKVASGIISFGRRVGEWFRKK